MYDIREGSSISYTSEQDEPTDKKSPNSDADEGNGNGKDNGNGESQDIHDSSDAEVVFEDQSAIESANIFQTQQDVRDFAMIAAKHLAGKDEQSIYEKLFDVFEVERAIGIPNGANLSSLRKGVYNAALKVLPTLDESYCDSIVNDIVQQFREVMKIDQRIGPNFIEDLVKTYKESK